MVQIARRLSFKGTALAAIPTITAIDPPNPERTYEDGTTFDDDGDFDKPVPSLMKHKAITIVAQHNATVLADYIAYRDSGAVDTFIYTPASGWASPTPTKTYTFNGTVQSAIEVKDAKGKIISMEITIMPQGPVT